MPTIQSLARPRNLVIALTVVIVVVVVALSANSRAAREARGNRQTMGAWQATHEPEAREELRSPVVSRYLDSRKGAALERTVKRIISSAGYRCDRIRRIQRMEADYVARLGVEDGRWVDCNDDGTFGVLESVDGFRAVKR